MVVGGPGGGVGGVSHHHGSSQLVSGAPPGNCGVHPRTTREHASMFASGRWFGWRVEDDENDDD